MRYIIQYIMRHIMRYIMRYNMQCIMRAIFIFLFYSWETLQPIYMRRQREQDASYLKQRKTKSKSLPETG